MSGFLLGKYQGKMLCYKSSTPSKEIPSNLSSLLKKPPRGQCSICENSSLIEKSINELSKLNYNNYLENGEKLSSLKA